MGYFNIENRLTKICVCRYDYCLDSLVAGRSVVIITDTNIYANYRELIERYNHIIIGVGEQIKTLDTVGDIYSRLMSLKADRSTLLIGVGGGIVTDITGFVAATYMRGVKFGFISTTLLGQVDASVGGKNGVNVAEYKNMVGTFTHPEFVILDVDMLKTLPIRDLRAGMAEVVKAAIIGDRKLFEELENRDIEHIFEDRVFVEQMVARALRVKLAIVEQDERESGLRRLLNLGHTIGHAIEKSSREYNHGEAVAIGMAMIAKVSVQKGVLNALNYNRIIGLLQHLGFVLECAISKDDILAHAIQDKKRSGDKINLVMPVDIGRCEVVTMSYDELRELL